MARKRGSTPDGPHRTASATPAHDAGQLAEYQRKRDFTQTAEPEGRVQNRRSGSLRFVIQKHAASHLHFDLRLEIDGVMKSWAVPKGPSADPTVKRLAMQVEDHPVAYNSFEGTIPAPEYGGGTVMLWDTGTYTPDGSASRDQDDAVARAGYERGDLEVTLHGKRMHGSWVLVRTHGPARGAAARSDRPAWLLIKRRDEAAIPAPDGDLVRDHVTSVTTGRTMDEIRAGARPHRARGALGHDVTTR